MDDLLCKIAEGLGTVHDLALLIELSDVLKSTSLCGLGQTAPNPVLTTLRHFKHEYEDHVHRKVCPAGACTSAPAEINP